MYLTAGGDQDPAICDENVLINANNPPDAPSAQSKDNSSGNWKTQQYQRHWTRFVVALAVFGANMANGIICSTYAPISPAAISYFDTSSWVINGLSLIFAFIFVLFVFPAMWCIDTKGMASSLWIGTVGNIFGSLTRYLSILVSRNEYKLIIIYMGQIIASISQPFLLGVPANVANLWFGDTERLTANTVQNLGQPLGIALIFGIAPALLDMNMVHLITFLISLGLSIPTLFVLKSRPKIPPSKAALESMSLENKRNYQYFMLEIKKVFVYDFIILFLVFSCIIGGFNVFTTLLAQYIQPYDFNEGDAGILGVIVIATGLISSFVVCIPLDKNPRLVHPIFKSLCVITSLSCLLFALGCVFKVKAVIYLGAAIIGWCGFPLMPLILEEAVECTFPVNEGITSGGMWMGAQGLSVIMIVLSNAVGVGVGGLWILVGVVGTGLKKKAL